MCCLSSTPIFQHNDCRNFLMSCEHDDDDENDDMSELTKKVCIFRRIGIVKVICFSNSLVDEKISKFY